MLERINRSLKYQESVNAIKPLNYEELIDTIQGLIAQSGLTPEDVETTIVNQLRKLVAKNYLEENPDKHIEVVVEKDKEQKTLLFYNVADDKKEPLQFIRQRKDKEDFLKNIITHLDTIRATREYEKYSPLKNSLIEGTIEREEFSGYVVNIGKFHDFKARGFLPKNECIDSPIEPRALKAKNKIKACIATIKAIETRAGISKRLGECAPHIILSRKKPEFLAELLKEQCYEIQDGIVKIEKVVREPGIRAKIAVSSTRKDVDPRGACIGPHATRIKPIREELSNERIDIVEWSDDPKTLIARALAPAKFTTCIIRPPINPDDKPTADIYAPPKKCNQIIGHRGANVRLTYQLTGIRINIVNANYTSANSVNSYQTHTNNLVNYLEIDAEFAAQLINHGYSSTFVIATATVNNLLEIPGIDAELAEALLARAIESQEQEESYLRDTYKLDNELLLLLKTHKLLYLGYELVAMNLLSIEAIKEFQATNAEIPDFINDIYSIIN